MCAMLSKDHLLDNNDYMNLAYSKNEYIFKQKASQQ